MAKNTPQKNVAIKPNEDIRKQPGNLLFIIGLLAITFFAFYPCLSAYFVNWDDIDYVLENKSIAIFSQEWNWDAVTHLFVTDTYKSYNPLSVLTFAIEKFFFAPDTWSSPFIFHFDNLLLHLGCTVCVFFLFLKMNLTRWAAFAGALLFGIHPMRVESVAWITERKDVLYGLFFLLALLAYINYIKEDRKEKKWYIVALAFSVLAYFSKIQAVSLPLCMIVFDYYFDRKWYSAKLLLFEKLPWWLLSFAIGIINLYFLSVGKSINAAEAVTSYSFFDKLAVGAYTYGIYVVKFIYPFQMFIYHEYPVHLPAIAYGCLILVPLFIIFLCWQMRNNKVVLFTIAFFTFNVMFVLQIFSAGVEMLADRFTYIAYIGLIFGAAKAYEWLQNHKRYIIGINALLALYFLRLIYVTYNQNKVWQNTVTLWSHTIDEDPVSYNGYYQIGTYYLEILTEHLPDPYINAADSNIIKLPLYYFDMARKKDSLNGCPFPALTTDILVDRGASYGMVKMYEAAINDFTKALIVSPNKKDALIDRAWYYSQFLNRNDLAIEDYERCEKLGVSSDVTYYRSAICKGNMQRLRDGLQDINKAIAINSTNPEYYIARANFYRSLSIVDSMHADAQKAQTMGANVPAVLLK